MKPITEIVGDKREGKKVEKSYSSFLFTPPPLKREWGVGEGEGVDSIDIWKGRFGSRLREVPSEV